MASSLIHMCVASEINKKYNLPKNMLLLGSIAPDISKLVGETKVKSHFWDDKEHIRIEWFLDKYKDKINHPFMLGYFIHLYTDLLWEKYFISDIVKSNCIELLDGTKVEPTLENQYELIYKEKAYVFKIEHIKPFIKTCTDIITGLIDEMGISF